MVRFLCFLRQIVEIKDKCFNFFEYPSVPRGALCESQTVRRMTDLIMPSTSVLSKRFPCVNTLAFTGLKVLFGEFVQIAND